jgi:hypothetical protein
MDFEFRIDALVDNLGGDQLIDVKDAGMAQVKNQGVPQRFCAQVKRVIGCQAVVEPFVDGKGFMEVVSNFLTLIVR